MVCSIFRSSLVVVVSLVAAASACAQGPPNDGGSQHGGPPPVYQRHGVDWGSKGFDRRRESFQQFPQQFAPQVSSGWFQRPYPYHLDYYKMKYGGSYAPYFGNLYGTPFGTPQVVNWNVEQGSGGWDSGPAVYPPQVLNEAAGYPNGNPPGAAANAQVENRNSSGQQVMPPKSESLPAPSP